MEEVSRVVHTSEGEGILWRFGCGKLVDRLS